VLGRLDVARRLSKDSNAGELRRARADDSRLQEESLLTGMGSAKASQISEEPTIVKMPGRKPTGIKESLAGGRLNTSVPGA
jgi:hypothetical protein